MKTYAVLLSGGLADQDGYNEFWNDLVDIWKLFNKKSLFPFNASEEDVFVMYGLEPASEYVTSSGDIYYDSLLNRNTRPKTRTHIKNFPNRRIERFVDYSATVNSINEVLGGLSKVMTEEDILFVWTFGHGFRYGSNSWLHLADGNRLYDNNFADMIKKIPCSQRIICMQQCFSGGFIDYLKDDNKNIIITATSDTEFAYRADNMTPDGKNVNECRVEGGITYYHSEFNLHLTKQLNDYFGGRFIEKENTIKDLKIKNIGKVGSIVSKADMFSKESMPSKANSLNKTLLDIYKTAQKNDSTYDNPMYLDCFNTMIKRQKNNQLKTSWCIDKYSQNLSIEFGYSLDNIYYHEENKIIDLYINGEHKHTFKIDLTDYIFQHNTKLGSFRINGSLKADYSKKIIKFEGSIIMLTDRPYCRGQDYALNTQDSSLQIDQHHGLSCELIAFNWI